MAVHLSVVCSPDARSDIRSAASANPAAPYVGGVGFRIVGHVSHDVRLGYQSQRINLAVFVVGQL